MVFAHGFGCDQNMWRLVAPSFERDFRTILYDPQNYSSLAGYAAGVSACAAAPAEA